MRKTVATVIASTMLITMLSGCGAEPPVPESTESVSEVSSEASSETPEEDSIEMNEIALGMSGYTVKIPSDYSEGDVMQSEREDGMIAYYRSGSSMMDFDVYEFDRNNQDLHNYALYDAYKYGADEVEDIEINGIPVALYYSNENYEGEYYKVANYLFANPNEFVELCFWLDGDDAKELTESIIGTLKKNECSVYDMLGTVIKKEAEYSYKVKGDNDEEFTCNYNGDNDLPEGTRVYVFEIADSEDTGYTIEPARESSGENLYTNENGVAVTKIEISKAANLYNLLVYFENPGRRDAEFDTGKFSLELYDGTKLTLSAADSKMIPGNSEYTQWAFPIAETLKTGDEISVYYGSQLISQINVSD